MLRSWQHTCITKAMTKYRTNQRHFLVQATPGAGKTLMAAHLAKKLVDENMVDFIVCISPSKSVSASIQDTFSSMLSCPFNGKIGSRGFSITYQSLRHLGDQFWSTLAKYRVLCVFDEIHHCAGDNEFNTNSWGHEILFRIESASAYTLALTGTPWRSDSTPVALASYSDAEGKITCDYQYSLHEAVLDKVCRRPTITLIDGQNLVLTKGNEPTQTFDSLSALFTRGKIKYRNVLYHEIALDNVLKLAVKKLASIRRHNPNAGGLIVAASVGHAKHIQELLVNSYRQTTVLVTYRHDNSQLLIDEFRTNDLEWIVSVGMVSEGTDIPRLQVCCHLSNVKTELHFRQVLGRILRTTSAPNQEAWLYTFAEPSLLEFSEEIERDIPESCFYVKFNHHTNDTIYGSSLKTAPLISVTSADNVNDPVNIDWNATPSVQKSKNSTNSVCIDIQLNQFKERVIEAFRYVS
ncbi:diguanylate cyclase [Enterovibrio norvegicus FF-33]|uniref:DEAD/DEAH box helicase n=1 Tax=Enterovibrio norvegicus TaxID=188144 RepID=UPI0002DD3F0B|nr:DEAD/DEAH box helicase family protein [Enterovibrio norvegicus]OEE68056.1 diguanylate cyclase [Enterovibrio norvegicus FF-33]